MTNEERAQRIVMDALHDIEPRLTAAITAALDARDAEHAKEISDIDFQRKEYKKAAREWMGKCDALSAKYEPLVAVTSALTSQAVLDDVIEVLKFYAGMPDGRYHGPDDVYWDIGADARECLRKLGVSNAS